MEEECREQRTRGQKTEDRGQRTVEELIMLSILCIFVVPPPPTLIEGLGCGGLGCLSLRLSHPIVPKRVWREIGERERERERDQLIVSHYTYAIGY